ncbi:hypothetical protein GCM10014715_89390 [Streptomyces spiralis]|uniref:Transposase DDE domain-containing protein n=1 Tax=Streptomyces spiralis TaxID=66376 RepID=A0A919ASF3_9ACTN|nr:hypothetical protein GCM10014715_89390 [Streptomyces spiralis]
MDLALTVALGGDCLADTALLRSQPAVLGPVASDPTVSRLIDTLAASGEKALTAIRTARSEVRRRVWELADDRAPDADAQVTVDLDRVLVVARSDKQDAAPDLEEDLRTPPAHGLRRPRPGRTGEPVAALLRPGSAGPNTAAGHVIAARLALARLLTKYRGDVGMPRLRSLAHWHPLARQPQRGSVGSITTLIAPDVRSAATRNASAAASIGNR